jgi:hypothetical protein
MARALAAAVPGIGGRASGPPMPLSRLPDVPSLFGPPGDPPTAASPRAAGESARPQGKVGAQPSPDAGHGPATPERGRGGTLSSLGSPAVVDPPVNVVIAPPKASFGETLPSKDGPLGRRGKGDKASPDSRRGPGVSVNLVVLLVVAALAAGFLLGWAFGRM